MKLFHTMLYLRPIIAAAIAAAVVTGCGSNPPAQESNAVATSQGPLAIHGKLARNASGQNALHLFVNDQQVIDGPLDELYSGSNSGAYGERDIRTDCASRRLNLHDFRVTCEVFVDDRHETTLGF